MESIIQQFIPDATLLHCERLSGGLINQTHKVQIQSQDRCCSYILQRLNTSIFRTPHAVMDNLVLVQQTLKAHSPLVSSDPLTTPGGDTLHRDTTDGYWRMLEYVDNAISYETPPSIDHVRKAGGAYGNFLTALVSLPPERLAITLSDFHHLDLRYSLLQTSTGRANADRRASASVTLKRIRNYHSALSMDFSALPLRAVHNDCKLSNLLFHATTDNCIAVIDLDTVMPGYVVTDFGDMVRGMCNTASEDEPNPANVHFSLSHYKALEQGFLAATGQWLTAGEAGQLLNGAMYIILEQAIRFLTDYLDGDTYYAVHYPDHNLDRACNQVTLLASLLDQLPAAR